MVEAVETYEQASRLAKQQTLDELMLSWNTDDRNTNQQGASGRNTTSSPELLSMFLLEQGFEERQAEATAQELLSKYPAIGVATLNAKMTMLQRVMPGADTVAMIKREPGLLECSSAQAVESMVALVDAFPGRDVIGMVTKQPKLLLCQDLKERAARVIGKLVKLHPANDGGDEVMNVVAENPELLFRMDYYMSARLLDELPIEIQNMMVLADQGLGFLYKYYKTKKQYP